MRKVPSVDELEGRLHSVSLCVEVTSRGKHFLLFVGLHVTQEGKHLTIEGVGEGVE